MNLNDEITAKIFVGLALFSLLTFIGIVLISLIFYQGTYETCLESCKEKYQFNIDNSWVACDVRCDERFERNSK